MYIKFIKEPDCTKRVMVRWSKEWPNWSGVVPQKGDTVLLHFGDYNEECKEYKVVQRIIDGTKPDCVVCMIEELGIGENV